MQNLTYPDICVFVNGSFKSNAGFAELSEHEPQYAAKFLKNIAEKAAGVFLWVHLVGKSLLAGFTHGFRVSDLQKTLDALPKDLEELFQGILNSIDPEHLEDASRIFQIHRASLDQSHRARLHQIYRASLFSVTILELSYADEEPESV